MRGALSRPSRKEPWGRARMVSWTDIGLFTTLLVNAYALGSITWNAVRWFIRLVNPANDHASAHHASAHVADACSCCCDPCRCRPRRCAPHAAAPAAAQPSAGELVLRGIGLVIGAVIGGVVLAAALFNLTLLLLALSQN